MNRFILFAYIVGSLLFAQGVSAQQWDTHGMAEADSKLGTLEPADREGIVKALHLPASKLRVLRLQTSPTPIFFVQSFGIELCGATGNCKSWILTNDYRVILRGHTQTAKLLSTQHDGRPDILTGLHDSATTSYLTQWSFKRTKYVRNKCAFIEYEDLATDRLKVPRVTPQPCVN